VAVTNRIDAHWQRAQEADPENHDIGYHTRIALGAVEAADAPRHHGHEGLRRRERSPSRKLAWREAGGFADGLLCVDHSIHFRLREAGRRIYLLENWYVYHRRRAFIGPLPDDTPRAEDCPCRGLNPLLRGV
jgi:hypothetical protein